MKFHNISIKANYGWPEGNRSAVIQVPDDEKDDIKKYIQN